MSGMAEVLAAHAIVQPFPDKKGGQCFCGAILTWRLPTIHQRVNALSAHQADALTAAGFGPVKEAQASSLEEAARELLSDESAAPKSIKEMYNAIYAAWLTERAAATRGEQ